MEDELKPSASVRQLTSRPQGRIRQLITETTFVDLAPVIVIAVYGTLWIALNASSGRGVTHSVFQALGLIENCVALLFRRRKPMGSLLSIVAVYAPFNVEAIQLPPLLVALFTVAILSQPRVIGAAIAAAFLAMAWHATDYLPSDPAAFVSYAWWYAVSVMGAVAAGLFVRSRPQIASIFGKPAV